MCAVIVIQARLECVIKYESEKQMIILKGIYSFWWEELSNNASKVRQ